MSDVYTGWVTFNTWDTDQTMEQLLAEPPLTGKERELLSRDELYFDIAYRVFLEEGFHSLTLARIAKETGFSRATVYERFGCKENLVAQLGIQCGREVVGIMRKALDFRGRPRERMFALGESIRYNASVFLRNMRILRVLDAEAVLPRVSPEVQAEMAGVFEDAFATMLTPIEEAIAVGDLRLGTGEIPEALCFTLWTSVSGWATTVTGGAPPAIKSLADPLKALRLHIRYLFDGVGWRPLWSEWDYEETARRIEKMFCPETCA